MPIILATQEIEIRKIKVQDQQGKKVSETPSYSKRWMWGRTLIISAMWIGRKSVV
jgi:hypothetical protein